MSLTSSRRYSAVAIALHWAIAAFIIFNLSLGFFMEGFPKPLKDIVVPLHISSGMTVLALTLVRILWRLSHRPPPLHPEIPPWERAAAHSAHALLYLLMLAMTITGWSVISAHPPNANGGPKYFGTFHLPQIAALAHIQPIDAQKAVHERLIELHLIGGYIFVALLVLHIAAALKHQFIDRQPELERMGIGRQEPL
ncbi:MAG: cytochrome b/b6 domain-containing protein [Steroidobacteraceae bacterium]